jgi:FkbM family methyltransferase
MSPLLPKRLVGRILYRLCDRLPPLQPLLGRWGLRTRRSWFHGHQPVARSRRTGRQLRLASFSENYLSFELFWRGLDFYEPVTTALARILTRSTPLFVDAGANIGFYSLMLASTQPELEVVAFEPHPKLHALFEANLRANRLFQVVAEPIALSDREGVLPFYLNQSDMSASLEPDFDSNHAGVVSVPVTTLDAYLAHRSRPAPRRFLLKVDIEGHEPAFFEGAQATLKQCHPDIIAETAIAYPPATVDLLHRQGYRFRQITDEGLLPCTTPAAHLRGKLVFLNCLLSTRPTAELDALSDQLRAQVRSINLSRTSKRADRRTIDRCLSSAKQSANPYHRPASVHPFPGTPWPDRQLR